MKKITPKLTLLNIALIFVVIVLCGLYIASYTSGAFLKTGEATMTGYIDSHGYFHSITGITLTLVLPSIYPDDPTSSHNTEVIAFYK